MKILKIRLFALFIAALFLSACSTNNDTIDPSTLAADREDQRQIRERVQAEYSRIRSLHPDMDPEKAQKEASDIVGKERTRQWEESKRIKQGRAERDKFLKDLEASRRAK